MSMIIKSIRLRSSSSISRLVRHLENGDENDAVDFVAGTPADIRDMHRDAISVGSRYAVRHWIIAPHEPTTRQQMTKMVGAIAKEFAFDPARAVIVEHRKRRSTDDAVDVHWHILVGEVDPTTGRILATSYDRIRHELIARMAEFAFGHAFVPGKHTEAVIKGLRKRGLHCVAERVEEFIAPSQVLPAEAFTHARHQECKRLGLDLPALKQAIKRSVDNAQCQEDIVSALAAVGLKAKAGDKPGIWIVVEAENGVLLGSLHRLAGLRKSAINDMMLTTAPRVPRDWQNAVDVVSSREKSPPADCKPPTPQSDASIVERIAEMEDSSLRELAQEIPAFEPTPTMQEAKEAVRRADGDLSAVFMRRNDLQMQIGNIPRVRWWSRFTGWSARRQKTVTKLATALDEVEAEIRRKEIAFTICRKKEVREERAAKEHHLGSITDLVQRQRLARQTLALAEGCRSILNEHPNAVAEGFEALVEKARTRIQQFSADQHQDVEEYRMGRSKPPRSIG